jgi:alkaline phosphatase
MRLLIVTCALAVPLALQAQERATNVILFIADAGGIPTLNAASLHGYGAPRRLFIQRMPQIGLSETSSAAHFVTDSAAGMTAIVTGRKTRNNVVSQAAAEPGAPDGRPLKSILDYAEEHGLATGIVTNDAVTGATPAALYAKSRSRGNTAAIFNQVFERRVGDGIDVLIGAGRPAIGRALAAHGVDIEGLGRANDRPVLGSLPEIPGDAARALVVLESSDFDPFEAVDTARRMLSRNKRGYFLMVEWDVHTDNLRRGLDRMVALDRLIERTASTAGRNTLIVFTADHSFDLRVRGGVPGTPLLDGLEEAEAKALAEKRRDIRIPAVRMDNGHTGEEVLVAAQGPGSGRVRGYLANTDIFTIMMNALGWKETEGQWPGAAPLR